MFFKYLLMENQTNHFLVGNDSSVFNNISYLAESYSMQILFNNPSQIEKGPFVHVIAHDKLPSRWKVYDRVWKNRIGVHYCVGGKGYYNGVCVQRGDCFVVLPNVSHSIEVDLENPMEIYWIIVKGDKLDCLLNDYGLRAEKPILTYSNVESIRSLFEICMTTDYNGLDIFKYTMAFAHMVLSSISHETNSSDDNLPNHENMILKNYISVAKHMMRESDYRCSVGDIANALGIDSKYFCRLFHSQAGESPKQYLMRKRLDGAVELLGKGVSPMNVAELMGYSAYADFYRAFKKKYSLSPSRFVTNSKGEVNNSN